MPLKDKYINPFTDYGFKKLFGSEPNKDILVDFLNQVLPEKHHLTDLTYAKSEQLGLSGDARNAIFDLYCIGKNGEHFIVEMPHFNKTDHELATNFDKWMYVLSQLPNLQERPRILQQRVFTKLFEAAEIAKFNMEERSKYEANLKKYRDLKNVIDTSFEEGKAEGFEEGKAIGVEEGEVKRSLEIARQMKQQGEQLEKITRYTGLSREDVEKR